MQSTLRLELPIAQSRVTAIGYHASGDGALALDPVGQQANQGLVSRVARSIFGGGTSGLRYYVLGGDGGPATASLDVGAAPGTDVYSPVDGTIVGITPYVLVGQALRRSDRHPAERQPVDRRLAHPPAARPEPDRRLAGRVDHLEARDHHQLRQGRAPGARALDAGRGQPRVDRSAPRRRALDSLKILFVADVFGTPGRAAVEERLPGLKEELEIGFCVVNGENVADGAGVTPRLADRLLAAGADVLTLGNHVWRRNEIGPYLESSDRVIRPANLSVHSPGRGLAVLPAEDGTPVAVLNLQGLCS